MKIVGPKPADECEKPVAERGAAKSSSASSLPRASSTGPPPEIGAPHELEDVVQGTIGLDVRSDLHVADVERSSAVRRGRREAEGQGPRALRPEGLVEVRLRAEEQEVTVGGATPDAAIENRRGLVDQLPAQAQPSGRPARGRLERGLSLRRSWRPGDEGNREADAQPMWHCVRGGAVRHRRAEFEETQEAGLREAHGLGSGSGEEATCTGGMVRNRTGGRLASRRRILRG